MSEVTTRREMADMLENVMNRAYHGLKEELQLERNSSMVKSYLLEAHRANKRSSTDILELVSQIFSQKNGRNKAVFDSVKETQDESLYIVRGNSRGGLFTFYLDTTDSRFWIAHTVSKSETSDQILNSILSSNPQLDCMWMPMEFLQRVLSLGSSRGLGLDFDRRFLDTPVARKRKNIVTPGEKGTHEPDRSPISGGNHLDYVKMQLWGAGSERILSALKDANLSQSTTISKIRLRTEASGDHDQFTLADVKFDGKITGRGTSFAVYNRLLLDVLGHYSSAVRSAEKQFHLYWETDKGVSKIVGEPFYIKLGEEGVLNLEYFCAKLFSGTEPFKLMGLPVQRNRNYYTASAIDLHINQRIDFEISRKTISVFLPNKACGNTLLRLYTNLQHYFSSDVKAIDGTGAEVFSFQS